MDIVPLDAARALPAWQKVMVLVLGAVGFVLLVACSLLGAVLIKREGSRTWSALRKALASGRMPAKEIADAALVLVGGVLLLTPGFVTAAVGLFFLLPFTRPVTRRWLELAVGRRLLRTPGVPPGMGGPSGTGPGRKPPPDDDVIEGEIL